MEDATIADINAAFDAGVLTSERLVELYLNRIEAYDKQGPYLNAIIALNPDALQTAKALDEERRTSGARGPLHGIPVLLKDNYDFQGMPTTAGCRALAESYPPDDAYQVRKLKEAGAIILGKTNLHEFAFDFDTQSSILGQTFNPYDDLLDNSTPFIIPGGSSGGTGAAIAANFAVIGTGTDTGGSIRVPSSFNSLVGIRPTVGLTSRDGIVPLSLMRDVGGPITRNVSDAAIMLDVLAGYDPADPVTAECIGRIPESYTDFLDRNGLEGARIGLIWQLPGRSTPHSEVVGAMVAAISEMHSLGAEVVAFPEISNLASMIDTANAFYNGFEYELNDYLAALGDEAPMKSLAEIVDSGAYLREQGWIYNWALRGGVVPEEDPAYHAILQLRESLRSSILEAMDSLDVDAILYPTATQPPPTSPGVNRVPTMEAGINTELASAAGFPAITVPGGFTSSGLPIGIELMARPFDEPTLISFAYAYEQATQHRQPPTTTPPLPGETIPEPGVALLVLGGAVLLFCHRH